MSKLVKIDKDTEVSRDFLDDLFHFDISEDENEPGCVKVAKDIEEDRPKYGPDGEFHQTDSWKINIPVEPTSNIKPKDYRDGDYGVMHIDEKQGFGNMGINNATDLISVLIEQGYSVTVSQKTIDGDSDWIRYTIVYKYKYDSDNYI